MKKRIKVSSLSVPVNPLTPSAFEAFGTVVENPAPNASEEILRSALRKSTTSTDGGPPQSIPLVVNQGTSLKYPNVTNIENLYRTAPSRQAGRAVVNLFVCMPRELQRGFQDENVGLEGLLELKILERHPFTTQTFIPIGLSGDSQDTAYLVVVAPTLPISKTRGKEPRPPPFPTPEPRLRRTIREALSRARPPPFPLNEQSRGLAKGQATKHPGPGIPDITEVKAFLASGSQAVTYGAGTWHSPMIALGRKSIDFIVLQYANNVGNEDCQETEIEPEDGGRGIVIQVPGLGLANEERIKARL
ncbi:MAG: Ureidoglycolate lyase [Vezdaea acicularis]|nr:MAG: Ureidoglycolate lyase [Vezdaea acicularis]